MVDMRCKKEYDYLFLGVDGLFLVDFLFFGVSKEVVEREFGWQEKVFGTHEVQAIRENFPPNQVSHHIMLSTETNFCFCIYECS